ncbi:hypothetical protein ABZ901_34305 [Actinacidiphila alni]|uniref:hypothetical protein n=1 Tax=Actinacidiphila alni TaxID=380248 RepID=UPI0033DA3443
MLTDGEDHGRMRRTTALTTTLLALALAGTALAGCSSSDDTSDASDKPSGQASSATTQPTGSAAAPTTTAATVPTRSGNGRLDYTGDASGTAVFTGAISCEVVAGKLIGVTAPDKTDASAPRYPTFIATTAGPQKLALLDLSAKQSFSSRHSGTVSGSKSGGTWKVTVKDLVIDAGMTGGSGQKVTVNGSLTCTKTTGH